MCFACLSGQACTDGVCGVAPEDAGIDAGDLDAGVDDGGAQDGGWSVCGASSCDGCCLANGTCVPLFNTADSACGASGHACTSCAGGEFCGAGVCMPSLDGGFTDGGAGDAGGADGGVRDGGVRDGGISDGGISDGGISDGGISDGGPDAG
jgi:hypothetical protein